MNTEEFCCRFDLYNFIVNFFYSCVWLFLFLSNIIAWTFPGFTMILLSLNYFIARLFSDSKRCIKFWMKLAGDGAIINVVLKFRKVIKFESSVEWFAFVDEKSRLSIKKVVKNLRNQSKIKTLGTCSNSCQIVFYCSPYVQVNSLNYLPLSSL